MERRPGQIAAPRTRTAEDRPDLRSARAALEVETRKSILKAAAEILSADGPEALTLRRVAISVNASTKVIYTHFGNKIGLLDALYLHSFGGLATAFEACMTVTDARERLQRLILTYRDYARAHPAFYHVMFGDLGRAYEAPPASRRQAWGTFETIRETLAACVPPDRRDQAGHISRLLWAAMHGVVSLELRGLIGSEADAARLFRDAVQCIARSHGFHPEIDDRQQKPVQDDRSKTRR